MLFAQIFVPEDAPDWAFNRSELWNRSEAAEKKGNAVIAREIQLALPHELSDSQRQEITARFARYLSDRYGVAIDACIHAPGRNSDERNYHAHLMICQRLFDAQEKTGLRSGNLMLLPASAGRKTTLLSNGVRRGRKS